MNMNKLNIAEILKNCPSGMALDCTMWDNLYFDRVEEDMIHCYYELDGHRNTTMFCKDGCYTAHKLSKCVIFPKGKTTWEEFVPPVEFKDGDVLVHTQNQRFIMSIYHKRITEFIIKTHCILWDKDEGLSINMNICCYPDNTRLATEEEKQILFDAIKDNGYNWNAETKTLEKLLIFKVGDRIEKKGDYISGIITQIDIENFYKVEYCDGSVSYINSKYQDNYELVPNKFDYTTLKPFDKVLVRCSDEMCWTPQFFSRFRLKSYFPFECTYNRWSQCIPYEGNEHLLGTTDDCEEFFKTWVS